MKTWLGAAMMVMVMALASCGDDKAGGTCQSTGATCSLGGDCCSDICESKGGAAAVCVASFSSGTAGSCLEVESTCGGPGDCCSQLCVFGNGGSGHCAASTAPDAAAAVDATTAGDGASCLDVGAVCTGAQQCCSQLCEGLNGGASHCVASNLPDAGQ